MLRWSMKNNQQATHDHKRAGTVVVLESTGELAKVLIPTTGDEFWVKLIDLTPLTDVVIDKQKLTRQLSGRNHLPPAANRHRRAVRAA